VAIEGQGARWVGRMSSQPLLCPPVPTGCGALSLSPDPW